MIVTEADIQPFRHASGVTAGEMPFSGLEAYRKGTSAIAELFTESHKMLAGELFVGKRGPDTLEIALFLAFTSAVPILKANHAWVAIKHQAGGHATRNFPFIGIRLKPRAAIYRDIRQIARDRWHAKLGNLYPGRVSARDIASYSTALDKIGLDCDFSYPHLMESVYPIDAVQDNLDRVAEDAPQLKDIGSNDAGMRTNSNLIIVGITQNSD